MINDKKLLDSINSTVQMGQIGIRSVLETAIPTKLRQALQSQLREYDTIETQAHGIAHAHGWNLKEVNPAVRHMADCMTRARLYFGNVETKVAAMMIQGNTRGMIIGYKDLHKHAGNDGPVRELSQRLLDCEQSNIRQMQGFL